MPEALIAGGGIGGLTAALCLRAHGWDVTVLEKAPDLAEVGAGLQLSPNAMKVFEALELDRTLAATGFTPDGIEIRMGESGMRLLHAPLGKTAVDRWGSPYLHIHRADLLDCLAQQLDNRAPGALRLGTAVTRYGQDGAGVTAVLETGETLSANIAPSFVADSGELIVSLAAKDWGLALMPKFLVADELDAGRLQPVMQDWTAPEIWLTAFFPPYEELPEKVAVFTSFIEDMVAGNPDILS